MGRLGRRLWRKHHGVFLCRSENRVNQFAIWRMENRWPWGARERISRYGFLETSRLIEAFLDEEGEGAESEGNEPKGQDCGAFAESSSNQSVGDVVGVSFVDGFA